jgi:hypothetical protein
MIGTPIWTAKCMLVDDVVDVDIVNARASELY